MVNTLRDMFVKPGLITYNYNQGKRARYVSPMKLFIFVSFVFFLLLGFKNARNYESPSDNAFNINLKMNIAHIDSADINILTAKNQLTNAYLDSFCAVRRVKLGWFNRPLVRNYLRIKSGHISMEEFNNRVIKSASTMVFFLMPLFALFVYLFYRKIGAYYSECLVFSVHIHTVTFLVFTVWMLAGSYLPGWLFALLILPSIIFYYIFSVRVVFKQGFGYIIGTSVVLFIMYLITLLVLTILSLIYSLI